MSDFLIETDRHLSFNTYCSICQKERVVFRKMEGYTVTTWCLNCGVLAVRQIKGPTPPKPVPGTVLSAPGDQKIPAPPVPESVKRIPGYGEPGPLGPIEEEDL